MEAGCRLAYASVERRTRAPDEPEVWCKACDYDRTAADRRFGGAWPQGRHECGGWCSLSCHTSEVAKFAKQAA